MLPRPSKFNHHPFDELPYDLWEYILINFIEYDDLMSWFELNEGYYDSFIRHETNRTKLCRRIFSREDLDPLYHMQRGWRETVYTHEQRINHGKYFYVLSPDILFVSFYLFGELLYSTSYKLTKNVTMDSILESGSVAGCRIYEKSSYYADKTEGIEINKRGEVISRCTLLYDLDQRSSLTIDQDKMGRIIRIYDGRQTWVYNHTGKLIRYNCPDFTAVFTLNGKLHYITTKDGEYVTYKGHRLYNTRMGYPDGNPVLTTDDFEYDGNLDE